VWDGAFIVAELNTDNAVVNRFLRGTQLIRREYNPGGIGNTGSQPQLEYYLHDGRGSVVHRTNDAGTILRTYRYDAFGNEWQPDRQNTNPFRFNGEYFDFETGRYYLRFRSYCSRTGRFTQEDPLSHALLGICIIQAGNMYMFCKHNPVMWQDPWGLSAEQQNREGTEQRIHIEHINFLLSQVPTHALLYYIVRNNNGTINSDLQSNEVTVSINGFTEVFARDTLYNNGHYIISRSVLFNNFGLSVRENRHRSGDVFTSMDTAAIAFSLMYTNQATAINREMGAIIYSTNRGYTFGGTWTGGERDVIFGFATRTALRYHTQLFTGRTMVALAHTHPENSNVFSPQDMSIALGKLNLIGVPTIPVFLSVNMRNDGFQVRRFDSTMSTSNPGGSVLVRW